MTVAANKLAYFVSYAESEFLSWGTRERLDTGNGDRLAGLVKTWLSRRGINQFAISNSRPENAALSLKGAMADALAAGEEVKVPLALRAAVEALGGG